MTGASNPEGQIAAPVEALSVEEMYRADERTIAGGVPGVTLMENAGRAVAAEIRRRWTPRETVVLAGPGANGGDGWVVARLLRAYGWPVRIALLGERDRLSGDTAAHAARWDGPVAPMSPAVLEDAGLIVDALFGAGLSRPLQGTAAAMAAAMAAGAAPVVAVDLPSGVDGDTGAILGAAAPAAASVTFFRKKIGHLLAPGRFLCGDVIVADIGIPAEAAAGVRTFQNTPALWPETPATLNPAGHKYGRGHALVAGGRESVGAAKLAAGAALRSGAGLVTIAAPRAAWPQYAVGERAVMARPIEGADGFRALLADTRFSVLVFGPGLGLDASARATVEAADGAGRTLVLDADALTLFAENPEALFHIASTSNGAVMTPHEGEFRRLFPDLAGDKLTRARAAARRAGCVVLLKGADTVIAAPDGRAAINANAPPFLATAGAGDVLSGAIAGLLAEGAEPFEAAAAGAWIHGAAAQTLGRGMTADRLMDAIPAGLTAALKQRQQGERP